MSVLATAAELLLGGACPGCGRPGWRLCSACRAALLGTPRRVSRRLPGLPPTWATASYDGPAHEVVIAAKEHGVWRACDDLGAALARAVASAALELETEAVTLVPMPSSRAAVRRRGLDTTRRIAERAATSLAGAGMRVVVAPCLAHMVGVADQAGLDAAGRLANVRGALGLARPAPGGPVVVVDDVVTTGASLLAATEALRGAGADVVAAACVAARGWS